MICPQLWKILILIKLKNTKKFQIKKLHYKLDTKEINQVLEVNDARKRKETVGFNTGSWRLFGGTIT